MVSTHVLSSSGCWNLAFEGANGLNIAVSGSTTEMLPVLLKEQSQQYLVVCLDW